MKWIVWLLLTCGVAYGQAPKLVLPVGHAGLSGFVNSAEISPDGKKILTNGDETAMIWDSETGFLIANLNSHLGSIHSALFCLNGKKIVTGVFNKTFELWDAETGTFQANLIGHRGNINSISISKDGRKIITASDDSSAKIWDAEKGSLLVTLIGHNHWLHSANFSNDGKKVVTSSRDETAKIWDAETGSLLVTLDIGKSNESSASFNPDGTKVITFSYNETPQIWDANTGRLIIALVGHTSRIISAVFSGDGKKIVTTSYDNTAIIWDAETGELLTTLRGHQSEIFSASFSRDEKRVVTASNDNTAKIWDVKTGKLLFDLNSHKHIVKTAIFSPDGNRVITSSYDGTAKTWNVQTGELMNHLRGHSHKISIATFTPDGKKIITSDGGFVYKIWDLQKACLQFNFTGLLTCLTSVSVSKDSKNIIMCVGNDASIWDIQNGKSLVDMKGHTNTIIFSSFSPDSKKIVTASQDKTAKIWNAQTGKLLLDLKGHTDEVTFAGFSPDGKKVITLSDDNNGKIWNVENGKELSILHQLSKVPPNRNSNIVNLANFSSDGKKIITVTGGEEENAKIWDVNTGKLLIVLKGHSSFISTAFFSPDGKKIVTSSWDSLVKIWDTKTGKLLINLKGHAGIVSNASLSFDGQKIITSSDDHTAKIWDASSGALIHTLKGHSSIVETAFFNSKDNMAITASDDNTCKIWNVETGKEICSFFALDTFDYFFQIPNGYYKCTPAAAKLLHYVTKDLKVITFEQLDVKYNRPDKVLEAIGCPDTNLVRSYNLAYYKRIKKLRIDTAAFSDEYTIPEADFADRANIEYEQQAGILKLHIKGNDSRVVLDRFNVWVNESPIFGVGGISIKGKHTLKIDTTITVTLSQGKNNIETSITNVNATESYRKPLAVNYTPIEPVQEKVYFIGIGMDRFHDNSNNLQWSVKDIRDEAKALQKKFGNNCIVVDTLFNERVSIESIKALKKQLVKTSVDDKVIIAYSGHGLFSKDFDYYLSTYNINFNMPEEGGLSYDELENLLDSIPARKKLLLLDACHSGEIDKDELLSYETASDDLERKGVRGLKFEYDTTKRRLGSKNSFELMQSLFVNVGRNTGAIIISAAGGTQFAYEKGDLRNAVFTHCMLEEMRKEHVSVSRLQQNVSAKVSELTSGLQVPTSRSEVKNVDWEVW